MMEVGHVVYSAKLSIVDMRRSVRHHINRRLIGEHRLLGDVPLELADISAEGFMAESKIPLGCGERILIRLPIARGTKGHVVWSVGNYSGFQFERIINRHDFADVLKALKPAYLVGC